MVEETGSGWRVRRSVLQVVRALELAGCWKSAGNRVFVARQPRQVTCSYRRSRKDFQ